MTYIAAVSAEIQRIEDRFIFPGGEVLILRKQEMGLAITPLPLATRMCMRQAIAVRRMQLTGNRVDVSDIYVTKQGRGDHTLVNGDVIASREFLLFGPGVCQRGLFDI